MGPNHQHILEHYKKQFLTLNYELYTAKKEFWRHFWYDSAEVFSFSNHTFIRKSKEQWSYLHSAYYYCQYYYGIIDCSFNAFCEYMEQKRNIHLGVWKYPKHLHTFRKKKKYQKKEHHYKKNIPVKEKDRKEWKKKKVKKQKYSRFRNPNRVEAPYLNKCYRMRQRQLLSNERYEDLEHIGHQRKRKTWYNWY